jgi:hypothetical protein
VSDNENLAGYMMTGRGGEKEEIEEVGIRAAFARAPQGMSVLSRRG